jgi:hypothetical protein
MSDLQQRIKKHRERKAAEYRAVMREEQMPPSCFTCDRRATHVSEGITPAGYHAWQCDRHARSETEADLWGSDPGWPTVYLPVEEASARYQERHHD